MQERAQKTLQPMKKLEIIKKTIEQKCYKCGGEGFVLENKYKYVCSTCNGSGKWEESIFYHVYSDKKGNRICFDGDTLK